MSIQDQEDHCIKAIPRNIKKFVYKGKEFPVNFDCIKNNSNYFYDNSENFQDENIELQIEFDVEKDTINSFIKCCENKPFKVNDSNVFHLDYLSTKYDVPELSKITKEYIGKPNTNLAFQSLLFKYEFQKKISISNDDMQFVDTSKEEDIIGQRLKEYLNDDRLLDLPIPILDRILKKYLNENDDQNIIEFLFKCLDKYKRKASILFLNINMDNQSYDLIIRLMNDYSDIFDFNMVNLRSILNTSSELLKELTKVKIEFTEKISEMNQIIAEQKNEINKFNENKSLIDNDLRILIQKQNQDIEEQNNKINENKSLILKQNQTIEEQKNKINENKNLIDNDLRSLIQKQNQTIEEQNNKINENKDLILKQNQTIEELKRIIDELRISSKSLEFQFKGNEFNGIFNYLRNISNIEDEVNATISSSGGGCQPILLLKYDTPHSRLCTGNSPNQWVCFELKNHKIIPNYYTIKTHNSPENDHHPRSWVIEGSNNNINWMKIDEQNDCAFLNGRCFSHSFQIANQDLKEFKYIRMRLTGRNWNSDTFLCIDSFELYGYLL